MALKRRGTRVSFMASGSGHIFFSVARAIVDGRIRAKFGVVITDRKEAGVRDKAEKLGIPSRLIDPSLFPDHHIHEEAIIKTLDDYGTELIVLAGYLRILSPCFVAQYPNRIINVHPSLLPSFPGLKSQKKAVEYGVKISGCTVHFVDHGIDTGPIIFQKAVPVMDNDTERSLAMRIRKEESMLLINTVKLYCEGKLMVSERHVRVKRGGMRCRKNISHSG